MSHEDSALGLLAGEVSTVGCSGDAASGDAASGASRGAGSAAGVGRSHATATSANDNKSERLIGITVAQRWARGSPARGGNQHERGQSLRSSPFGNITAGQTSYDSMLRSWLACSWFACSLACTPHELEHALPDISEQVETSPACEAVLGDEPISLFGGAAIIIPPRGVEFASDDNPMVTMSVGSPTPTACDRSLRRMVAMVYADEPDKSLHVFVNEFLLMMDSMGYMDGVPDDTFIDEPGHLSLSQHYPAVEHAPAVDLYFAFIRRSGQVIVLLFEAYAGDLDALRPSLEASVATLKLGDQPFVELPNQG